MKKYNILTKVSIFSLVIIFSACQKDAEIGGTAVQDMSGDWHVRVNGGDSYFTLYTFNTSNNDADLMWIQCSGLKDGDDAIGIKGKVPVEYSQKTFSGENIENSAATKADIPTFSIAKGTIIPNGSVGPVSETPTDSIYFELNINGEIFKISGHHKTGFLEDLP